MTQNVPIGTSGRVPGRRPAAGRRRPAVVAAGLLGAAVLTGLLTPSAAVAASGSGHPPASLGSDGVLTGNPNAAGELPSPPRPPSGLPTQPSGYQPPASQPAARAAVRTGGTLSGARTTTATPSQAKTWGASGSATTLVVYDSTSTYGWLGELYAIGAGNLATHFGKVTAEPVVDYQAGQVNDYTATIYLGSTYNEPIPGSFLTDVLSTSKPVMWVGDNIWQLSGTPGSPADTAFQAAYGWDPSTSYFDTTDSISTVSYKGQAFTRSLDNAAGILAPHITAPSAVTVLASADCATTCAGIAQTTGTSFPWAISSHNLMYVGEIPFSYMSLTDRYIAFSDLLFDDLAPTATASHLALIRLEDISPQSSPASLESFASYLKSQNIPFSMAVIPLYEDPNGYYNNGSPVAQSLAGSPVVPAIRQAVSDGGTIVQHGYTHQYSNADNPFTGVTGDDFEFYRAQCATTNTPPYTFQAPCPNSDYVVETGPVPGDSQLWASTRALLGRTLFTLAGLPAPTIWTTPHYAASAADYAGIGSLYSTRYEQELFFGGQLAGGAINYSHVFGQFFPYEVHDLYGTTIIPENLGDYEPAEQNNNPPRTAQDILDEARLNTTVTQGVASFFVHPDYDPLAVLEQIVQGIVAEGYKFVSPQTLMADNG
jgi:uncharacterized protein YdaL